MFGDQYRLDGQRDSRQRQPQQIGYRESESHRVLNLIDWLAENSKAAERFCAKRTSLFDCLVQIGRTSEEAFLANFAGVALERRHEHVISGKGKTFCLRALHI